MLLKLDVRRSHEPVAVAVCGLSRLLWAAPVDFLPVHVMIELVVVIFPLLMVNRLVELVNLQLSQLLLEAVGPFLPLLLGFAILVLIIVCKELDMLLDILLLGGVFLILEDLRIDFFIILLVHKVKLLVELIVAIWMTIVILAEIPARRVLEVGFWAVKWSLVGWSMIHAVMRRVGHVVSRPRVRMGRHRRHVHLVVKVGWHVVPVELGVVLPSLLQELAVVIAFISVSLILILLPEHLIPQPLCLSRVLVKMPGVVVERRWRLVLRRRHGLVPRLRHVLLL